jgi:hypothetical protein
VDETSREAFHNQGREGQKTGKGEQARGLGEVKQDKRYKFHFYQSIELAAQKGTSSSSKERQKSLKLCG